MQKEVNVVYDNRPIGFIDSGFGGLTVVKQALKQLPNETVIFIGDSARCPYGPRPSEEVTQFTFELVNYLQQYDIKMLVVACNTATAAALPLLKEYLDIPVLGVILPGARAAIKASQNDNIGVIATQGTISSQFYDHALKAKKPSLHIWNKACPSLVDMVEGKTNVDMTKIATELSTFKDSNIDTLILGCTHFPMLKREIESIMGEDVTLIDSGVETINDVSAFLDYFNLSASPTTQPKQHRFFTTGDATEFKKVAASWLGRRDLTVESVTLNEGVNPMKKTILIATKNAGKAKEFQAIFGKQGYTVKTLLDYPEIEDVEETGVTFEENARLKAETIAKLLNVMVISDDSGLCVDFLDGAPGIYSARYAGEPKNDARNIAKLLAILGEVPEEKRTAKFHCTVVMAFPDRESIVATGELFGRIAPIPKGDGGFGYDPVFFLAEYNKTAAELGTEMKNKISHRKLAIDALMRQIESEGVLW
ncbi:glutamate racemase [Carnobacteriaceae bacterium zg-ZUI240]|nr:glutamate racemase [Carnobacteriaceae bacterium zg-ZUI240]